ncbi:MAG: inorganic diphosphatase [Phycisphaerales bacterium]
MVDDGQPDHKIVSVLVDDPDYADFRDAHDFPKHTFKMLQRSSADYKILRRQGSRRRRSSPPRPPSASSRTL